MPARIGCSRETAGPRLPGGGVSCKDSHRDILFDPVTIATSWRVAVRCSSVEAPTARCDSRGCPAEAHLRPHAEGAGRISSTSLLQLAGVSGCRGAKNEVWHLGSQAPSGGWRATRVDVLAA